MRVKEFVQSAASPVLARLWWQKVNFVKLKSVVWVAVASLAAKGVVRSLLGIHFFAKHGNTRIDNYYQKQAINYWM